MSNENNKPVIVIRDGKIKVSVWKAYSEKNDSAFYQTSIVKSYKDENSGDWKETDYLNDSELLKVSRLMVKAYDAIKDLQNAATGESSTDI